MSTNTKVCFTVTTIETQGGERYIGAAWEGAEFVVTQVAHETYTDARRALDRAVISAGKSWQLFYFQSGR